MPNRNGVESIWLFPPIIMRLIFTTFTFAFLAIIPFSVIADEVDTTVTDVAETISVSCDNLKGLDRALCAAEKRLAEKGEELPECDPGERHTQNQRAYCMIKGNKERKENVRSTNNRRSRMFSSKKIVKKARAIRTSTGEQADRIRAQRSQSIMERLQGANKTREDVKNEIIDRRALHKRGRQERRRRTTEVLQKIMDENEEELSGRIESLKERRARRRAEVNESMLMKRGDAKKNAVIQRERRRSNLEERRQRVR